MDNANVVTGIVLRAMPVGESDKRITILTKEYGKISAFARGARRPKSPLIAAAEPFAFGQFELYMGRTSNSVQKAKIHNYFRTLTEDFDTSCYGFYVLEVADYYCAEYAADIEMLTLLYQTLRALESGKFDKVLIRAIFEWKTLVLAGVYPDLFHCLSCGKEEQLSYIDFTKNGIYCRECGVGMQAKELDESCIYALQYVVSTPAKSLYSFRLTDTVLRQFARTVRTLFHKYTNHKFNSAQFLD
ncbi:DNA repair protein RecO [Eubacterium oxidoreducens]|uniref:DNA repair protein RecO n=1 Tax=Eubacterium oxidoreducens TaxID=1732 RepID=A0A1G6AY00_EUBOX|nr:DNA repair protein RecO [Eubacterium oxidoreducens]SDB13286.1 DNA replication and repair protein RecO [Eubacterium oxidoreducens]